MTTHDGSWRTISKARRRFCQSNRKVKTTGFTVPLPDGFKSHPWAPTPMLIDAYLFANKQLAEQDCGQQTHY